MRMWKRVLTMVSAVLLAVVFSANALFHTSGQVFAAGDNGADRNNEAFNDAAEIWKAISESVKTLPEELMNSELLAAGDSVSDWLLFDGALTGQAGDREKRLKALSGYVSTCYAEKGGLDRVKATEYHRIALTVMALGGDPTAFGTDRDGQKINLIADGTYDWKQTDNPGSQGVNAWIFALNTLDAGAFSIPEGAKYSREEIIKAILNNQENGAFGLTKGAENVDITAMALQALSRYRTQNTRYVLEDGTEVTVAESIEKALQWLSSQMSKDGYFTSFGAVSSESSSQVLIALYSLGIDPEQDARFQTENGNILTAFLSFKKENGMYSHERNGNADLMASEQAMRAFIAKALFEAGDVTIYELNRMELPKAEETETSESGDVPSESKPQKRTHSVAFWVALGCMAAVFAGCLIRIVKKGTEKDEE